MVLPLCLKVAHEDIADRLAESFFDVLLLPDERHSRRGKWWVCPFWDDVLIASVGGADLLESFAVLAFFQVYACVEFSCLANDANFFCMKTLTSRCK